MRKNSTPANLNATPVPAVIKNALTVEGLWQVERIGGVSMSPDGRQVVSSVTRYNMQDNKGSTSLWLFSPDHKPMELTACGDKDGDAHWSHDGKSIAFVAKRAGDEAPQIYLIKPNGGEAKRLTNLSTGVANIRWFADSKQLAFISWVWPDLSTDKAQATRLKEIKKSKVKASVIEHGHYRHWDHWIADGREPHLHIAAVRGGKTQDVMFGTDRHLSLADPGGHNFDVSADGRTIAFDFNPLGKERSDTCFKIALLNVADRRVKILNGADLYDYMSPRFSADGSQIACVRSEFGKHFMAPRTLAVIQTKNGQCTDWLKQWDREPAGNHQWAADAKTIYFTAEDEGRQNLYCATAQSQVPTLIASGGTISEFNCGAATLSYTVNSATHPTQLFLANSDGTDVQRIEHLNDKLLKGFNLGKVEAHWCKGANGDPVHVWVTYPPGFNPKKKYPLLQSIHGGPHTCFGDTWHARWNTQVFAAHGYIVACVQYHGSTSYGHKFKDAISGRWGALEAKDVDASTEYLIKKGYIDKDQVVATGGSYGGYMVAMLNGKVHRKPKAADPYKAYVCHAGCFDWVSMFGDDAWFWHWRELGAYYYDDMQKVLAQSPHNFAANMSTPTLVLHGELDYRVPVAQGFQYFNTLRSKGIESRLVYFPDENHWILKPQNSRLWFSEFFNWLARFVKPAI